MAQDGGIQYLATLNGNPLVCYFSYEVLEDVDPGEIFGSALEHFSKHKLKLLSIAEEKILNGHAHAGQIQIFSNDLPQ